MLMKRFLLLLLLGFAGCNVNPTPEPRSPLTLESPPPTVTAMFTATPLLANIPTPVTESTGTITGRVAFYSDRDGNPEIYTMNADGSAVTRLTNDPVFDDSPALSPDGAQIVFLTARHDPAPRFPELKYELYVMNSDGSNLQRLTETEAAEDHPAWSPDGRKISFDADYDGDGFYEIYTLDADGTNLTRLTANAANDQFADWSPDGTRIAFASDRNGNWDIFVMDADGSNQRALTDSSDWELFPAWSPDGMQIAYNGLAPRSRNTDVYVMPADGSETRQLTNAPGFDENPAWSPDGQWILFQTERDGNFEIYSMAADGSDQRPLTAHPADELWPSWGAVAPPVALLLLEKSSQALGLRETFQAALGDLDGDGDLDAVFANPMRNPGAVWLNAGDGTFVDTGQQLTQYGHGIGLADFDGDGDLDAVIVCHQNSAATQVYLNDGAGFFATTGQDFGDARISAADVNVLDLNGDGWMDFHVLYYSESGAPDQVYLNDGGVPEGAPAIFTDSGLRLEEDFIAWGDLDGDGDADYFGKRWGIGYVVMLNDGQGRFTQHWQMDDTLANVGDVALADFDGDSNLDALVSNGFRESGSQPARLLWNDGSGNFSDSGLRLNETMGAHFAVGDLDLDGRLDVFVANMDRPNEVWLNRGAPLRRAAQPLRDMQLLDSGLRLGDNAEMSGRPTLGDLDSDGDLDVVVGRFRGGAEIWFNQQP